MLTMCVLFLAGCGAGKITSFYYIPITGCEEVSCQMASLDVANTVKFHAFFECDPYGLSVGIPTHAALPYCDLTTLLTTPSKKDISYKDDPIELRDAHNHRKTLSHVSVSTYDEWHDGLHVKKNVYRYKFYSVPEKIEVIVPTIIVDGLAYDLPALEFELSELEDSFF